MRSSLLALAATLVLLLAGCSGQDGELNPNSTPTTTPTGTTVDEYGPHTCPPAEMSAVPPVMATQHIYDKIQSMTNNSGPGAVQGPWRVRVVGDTHQGDVLMIDASGFPPNGYYKLRVTKPRSHAEYTRFCSAGRFDYKGGMPFWNWDFRDLSNGKWDPPGTYLMTITDTTPGSPTMNMSMDVPFVINVPEKIR